MSLIFVGSPRFPDASAWGPSLRGLAGLGEIPDESCGDDVEVELALELGDDPGTKTGTKFSVLQRIMFHSWSQSLPSDRTASVSPRICTVTKSSERILVLPHLFALPQWLY